MKKTLFTNRAIQYVLIMTKYSTLVYIAVCCLCSFSLANISYGQKVLDKRLTINLVGESLPEALEKIASETSVKFAYTDYIINRSSSVTLLANNEKLSLVLEWILKPRDLTFTIIENTIILKKTNPDYFPIILNKSNMLPLIKPQLNMLKSDIPLSLRQITVRGKVTDGAGQPLPGVSVTIKGTMAGTATDNDGRYELENTRGDGILVFSFLGYLTKEAPVSGQKEINITLEQDIASLEEVVVVGYGSQKKQDITGAISSISETALKEVPVTNVQQMLQGRASGVYVVQSSNKPGAGASVQIRGRRSFSAGNDPLYVIDGIPITGGFNDINPSDIASIEVLKDASATAIYGSRGANGVVLVTTKRGTAGKIAVNYNNYMGVSSIFRHANMMTGEEFAEYRREAARTSGHYDDANPEESEEFLFEDVERTSLAEGYYTDWPRLLVRNGFTHNHDLNIVGGSEKTLLNISLGYFNDKGIIPGQDYTRYTTRANIDQKIGVRFKAGVSMLGSYSIRNGGDTNPYSLALLLNPLGKPYDDEGNLIFRPTSEPSWSNPLAEIVPGAVINENKRFRLLASLYGEAEIINGLKLRINFGPDLIQGKTGNFRGSRSLARLLGEPTASVNEDFVFNYTWENILTFNRQFTDKHTIDVTGLYSIQTRTQQTSNASVQGLPVESLEFYNLGSASIINGVGSGYSKWAILSYMGRINYSFEERFLLTLTGRFDGSSRFAPGHQWGFFPSIAAGWNLINERFLENNSTISNLKLRLSYGETGNTGIDPYQTQGLLSRTAYDLGGSSAYGYRPGSIRNNQLRWETTASANAGVDFSLWGNRLNGSFEFYRSKTVDLLLPRVLPITSGFSSVLENVGSTRNTGFEVTLSTLNIAPKNAGGFEWSTDINFSTNKEEILELSQGKVDDIGNARFIGQPITVYYDYDKTGIWQTGEEAQAEQFSSEVGQVKINDRNDNGVIDPDDRTILGTSMPNFSGGITNRIAYKGFDLSVFIFARFGNMIQSSFHQGAIFQLAGRYNNYVVDYWTEENPTNNYPRPNLAQERPLFSSTLTYFNGSFVKVRNINLGYNFSEKAASVIKASSLRIYASVQNPFIFAPYIQKHNGIDPESPVNDTPLSRLFMMGINVSF